MDAFGHDVGRVALAAPAHAYIERFPPGRLVYDQVGGVDRPALRDVHVPGVGEVRVTFDVVLGQLERRGPQHLTRERIAAGHAPDQRNTRLPYLIPRVDAEHVAVGQAPAGFSGLDAGVLPGHDEVTDAGDVAVRELDEIVGGDQAERRELVSGTAGEFGGLVRSSWPAAPMTLPLRWSASHRW